MSFIWMLRSLMLWVAFIALFVSFTSAQTPIVPTFTGEWRGDHPDLNPEDGRRDAFLDQHAPGGQCTMRAAVMEANATSAFFAPKIILPTDYYLLPMGALEISHSLTIDGAGARTTIIGPHALTGLFTWTSLISMSASLE